MKSKKFQRLITKKSLVIKNQYEENPFPRWRTTSFPDKMDLKNFIYKQSNNHFFDDCQKKRKFLLLVVEPEDKFLIIPE